MRLTMEGRNANVSSFFLYSKNYGEIFTLNAEKAATLWIRKFHFVLFYLFFRSNACLKAFKSTALKE